MKSAGKGMNKLRATSDGAAVAVLWFAACSTLATMSVVATADCN